MHPNYRISRFILSNHHILISHISNSTHPPPLPTTNTDTSSLPGHTTAAYLEDSGLMDGFPAIQGWKEGAVNNMFVILSDVWLDNVETLENYEKDLFCFNGEILFSSMQPLFQILLQF